MNRHHYEHRSTPPITPGSNLVRLRSVNSGDYLRVIYADHGVDGVGEQHLVLCHYVTTTDASAATLFPPELDWIVRAFCPATPIIAQIIWNPESVAA